MSTELPGPRPWFPLNLRVIKRAIGHNRFVIEQIRSRLAEYDARPIETAGHPTAAVLCALYVSGDEVYVVLTKRTDKVEKHKGEIAFPGGGCELDDADCIATALREAEEEIGLAPSDVRVIGRLDDIITITNYHVTVYVGLIEADLPYEWRLQAREVAEVIEVPLSHLLEPGTLIEFEVQRNGETLRREGYRFGEHVIWGATGRMLCNFLEAAVLEPETAGAADGAPFRNLTVG
ncbi:MAG: NUDIX domain-containing protein [Dehalococcoidia bacterium]|nr:NUDIX domain-containing protein [Dehalococcoidia bacterium]